MTEQNQTPRIGDVVLVDDRVGVVRYVGPLHLDKSIHFGIEIKGQPLEDGHDGTLDNARYFQVTQGHGIFTKEIDRVIRPEELLEKLASLYEIIKHDQMDMNMNPSKSKDKEQQKNQSTGWDPL